jgi:hypothetical protein
MAKWHFYIFDLTQRTSVPASEPQTLNMIEQLSAEPIQQKQG